MIAKSFLSVLASALAGCSFHQNSASSGGDPDAAAAGDAAGDASAAAADAPMPFPRTLHETNDDQVAPGASASCASGGHTLAQTWYRAFALSDYAIARPFQVTEVDVAVQSAASSAPIVVGVALYGGAIGGSTIDLSRTTPVASAQVAPPSSGTIAVPISAAIPAGGALVVSVASPDMTGSSSFVVGSTIAGEARPGYFAAAACGASSPITTAAAGAAGQIVIDVRGEVL